MWNGKHENCLPNKQRILLQKKSALEVVKHWQMLEVRHANIRLVGVYESPSDTAKKWTDINVALKRLREKKRPQGGLRRP